MSRKREHGRIISVESMTRGDALAEDVAAGATSITVEDAGDFDEDGGWLLIGGQVIEFTECDDDTGVILLVDPLTAAAEQGDPVQVWSDLYEEVIDYQQALVELDGEYDNPDPVVAEVAEGVGELPEGDRGRAGESCTLHRVSDDEWEVVGVGGRSRKSQAIRFEQDDTYTLTTADITAGTATLNLSHRPIDEALTCYLAGVPQRPTEWTIDYDAQTLTIPLDGWERAGMVLWVHYAYRKGIATARIVEQPTLVGANSAYHNLYDYSSYALPAGTQIGDLLLVVASGNVTDARLTRIVAGDSKFWVGTATTLDPLAIAGGANSTGIWYSATSVAVFRGGSVIDYTTVDLLAGETSVAIPAKTGTTVAAMAFSGFGTVDGSLYAPAGFTAAAASGSGKQSARVDYWFGTSPSPASTITRDGDVSSGTALLVRIA